MRLSTFLWPLPPVTRRYLINENVDNSGWPLMFLKKTNHGRWGFQKGQVIKVDEDVQWSEDFLFWEHIYNKESDTHNTNGISEVFFGKFAPLLIVKIFMFKVYIGHVKGTRGVSLSILTYLQSYLIFLISINKTMVLVLFYWWILK